MESAIQLLVLDCLPPRDAERMSITSKSCLLNGWDRWYQGGISKPPDFRPWQMFLVCRLSEVAGLNSIRVLIRGDEEETYINPAEELGGRLVEFWEEFRPRAKEAIGELAPQLPGFNVDRHAIKIVELIHFPSGSWCVLCRTNYATPCDGQARSSAQFDCFLIVQSWSPAAPPDESPWREYWRRFQPRIYCQSRVHAGNLLAAMS